MITHFAVMMCLNQRLSYFARQCTIPGVFLQCCLIHFNCFFRLNYTRRKQNCYITFKSFLHSDQIHDLHCNCWAAKENRIGQQHSCSLWTGSLFEKGVKKSLGEGPFSQNREPVHRLHYWGAQFGQITCHETFFLIQNICTLGAGDV